MSKEPSDSKPEPVLENQPVGDSGVAISKSEPAKETKEEPETKDSSEPSEEKEEPKKEVTFRDLKSVPSELQPIAKQMQADYTKEMQKLSEIRKTVSQPGDVPGYQEYGTAQDTAPAEVEEIKAFMATPQGSALRQVMDDIVSEKIGDLPQRVYSAEADKEIDAAINKYGKDAIEQNYDEIKRVMAENPTAPLDMVCSNVLYAQAKEQGKSELRQKLEKKSKVSVGAGITSPVTTPEKRVESFDEAFNQAVKEQNK